MRTDFDFAPLYRATVGFDRVFDMLNSMAGQPNHGGYPPYNIEKTADDAWRIVMAVAGFTEAELNVTQKEDELLVTGKGHPDRHEGTEYLYRGIGARDFERRFQLADHVRVTSARLQNGLLAIELQRELPEEKKPRPIRIEAQARRAPSPSSNRPAGPGAGGCPVLAHFQQEVRYDGNVSCFHAWQIVEPAASSQQ